MPSSSKKQARFMRAIAHGWTPARMEHPPSREVARKFMKADMRKMKRGKTMVS